MSDSKVMTAPAAAAPEPDAPDERQQRNAPRVPRRKGFSVGAALHRYALLIALTLLVLIFSALRPETFFSIDNFTTMLGIQAAAALLALGVTVVLLAGEFDLSVASTMGMSASVVAYLTTQHGTSVLVACVLALAISIVIGFVNALFVVKVGIHSFIVTLGMGTLV